MPPKASLAECVARWLRKMDWTERHRQWRRMLVSGRHPQLYDQVRALMAADELLDGASSATMPMPFIAVPLPNGPWRGHDNRKMRQTKLVEYFRPKPKIVKGKQLKLTRFFFPWRARPELLAGAPACTCFLSMLYIAWQKERHCCMSKIAF